MYLKMFYYIHIWVTLKTAYLRVAVTYNSIDTIFSFSIEPAFQNNLRAPK